MTGWDVYPYPADDAERALLGAAVSKPELTALHKLTGADFAHPMRGLLWDAIRAAHTDGQRPDPVTLTPHLPTATHIRTAVLELLVDVIGEGIAGNADHYAAVIRDRAERRRISLVLGSMKTRLDDLEQPVDDVVALAERELVPTGPLERAAEQTLTLDEFCDQPIADQDWVIDGMLARGERLVLTGVEGGGKSVLLRQMAVATAAGIDPFTLKSTTARRVLYVDCENPTRIMVHKFDDLRRILRARQRPTADRMWIRRFPQGLDLATPSDRLELHHLCTLIRPDLLVIGPVYKLYVGGAGAREEDLARQVTSTLDALREEFGFALILEHHSPHAAPGVEKRSVRPIGSSLWLRWPEFGFGIRPEPMTKLVDRQVEVKHWRGAREERPWPERLIGGAPHELPWIDPTCL